MKRKRSPGDKTDTANQQNSQSTNAAINQLLGAKSLTVGQGLQSSSTLKLPLEAAASTSKKARTGDQNNFLLKLKNKNFLNNDQEKLARGLVETYHNNTYKHLLMISGTSTGKTRITLCAVLHYLINNTACNMDELKPILLIEPDTVLDSAVTEVDKIIGVANKIESFFEGKLSLIAFNRTMVSRPQTNNAKIIITAKSIINVKRLKIEERVYFTFPRTIKEFEYLLNLTMNKEPHITFKKGNDHIKMAYYKYETVKKYRKSRWYLHLLINQIITVQKRNNRDNFIKILLSGLEAIKKIAINLFAVPADFEGLLELNFCGGERIKGQANQSIYHFNTCFNEYKIELIDQIKSENSDNTTVIDLVNTYLYLLRGICLGVCLPFLYEPNDFSGILVDEIHSFFKNKYTSKNLFDFIRFMLAAGNQDNKTRPKLTYYSATPEKISVVPYGYNFKYQNKNQSNPGARLFSNFIRMKFKPRLGSLTCIKSTLKTPNPAPKLIESPVFYESAKLSIIKMIFSQTTDVTQYVLNRNNTSFRYYFIDNYLKINLQKTTPPSPNYFYITPPKYFHCPPPHTTILNYRFIIITLTKDLMDLHKRENSSFDGDKLKKDITIFCNHFFNSFGYKKTNIKSYRVTTKLIQLYKKYKAPLSENTITQIDKLILTAPSELELIFLHNTNRQSLSRFLINIYTLYCLSGRFESRMNLYQNVISYLKQFEEQKYTPTDEHSMYRKLFKQTHFDSLYTMYFNTSKELALKGKKTECPSTKLDILKKSIALAFAFSERVSSYLSSFEKKIRSLSTTLLNNKIEAALRKELPFLRNDNEKELRKTTQLILSSNVYRERNTHTFSTFLMETRRWTSARSLTRRLLIYFTPLVNRQLKLYSYCLTNPFSNSNTTVTDAFNHATTHLLSQLLGLSNQQISTHLNTYSTASLLTNIHNIKDLEKCISTFIFSLLKKKIKVLTHYFYQCAKEMDYNYNIPLSVNSFHEVFDALKDRGIHNTSPSFEPPQKYQILRKAIDSLKHYGVVIVYSSADLNLLELHLKNGPLYSGRTISIIHSIISIINQYKLSLFPFDLIRHIISYIDITDLNDKYIKVINLSKRGARDFEKIITQSKKGTVIVTNDKHMLYGTNAIEQKNASIILFDFHGSRPDYTQVLGRRGRSVPNTTAQGTLSINTARIIILNHGIPYSFSKPRLKKPIKDSPSRPIIKIKELTPPSYAQNTKSDLPLLIYFLHSFTSGNSFRSPFKSEFIINGSVWLPFDIIKQIQRVNGEKSFNLPHNAIYQLLRHIIKTQRQFERSSLMTQILKEKRLFLLNDTDKAADLSKRPTPSPFKRRKLLNRSPFASHIALFFSNANDGIGQAAYSANEEEYKRLSICKIARYASNSAIPKEEIVTTTDPHHYDTLYNPSTEQHSSLKEDKCDWSNPTTLYRRTRHLFI